MTAVEDRRPMEIVVTDDVAEAEAKDRSGPNPVLVVGVAIVVLAVLLLVFEHWVTTVQEARSQSALLQQMKKTLSTAAEGGAAPRPHPGQAVGLLEIPAIGIEKVVVEGTSSRRLQAGPGRAPDSAYPGEPGDTLLLGRRSTYGKPFAHLDRLEDGDHITLTTGSGQFTYVVDEETRRAVRDSTRATLTLATSSPALLSDGTQSVVARLDGRPLRTGRANARAKTVDPAPAVAFVREPGAVIAAAFWALVLVAVLVAATRAYRRSAWLAWLLTTPVVVAVLFCLFGSLDRLLPVTR
jgi:sortase A